MAQNKQKEQLHFKCENCQTVINISISAYAQDDDDRIYCSAKCAQLKHDKEARHTDITVFGPEGSIIEVIQADCSVINTDAEPQESELAAMKYEYDRQRQEYNEIMCEMYGNTDNKYTKEFDREIFDEIVCEYVLTGVNDGIEFYDFSDDTEFGVDDGCIIKADFYGETISITKAAFEYLTDIKVKITKIEDTPPVEQIPGQVMMDVF